MPPKQKKAKSSGSNEPEPELETGSTTSEEFLRSYGVDTSKGVGTPEKLTDEKIHQLMNEPLVIDPIYSTPSQAMISSPTLHTGHTEKFGAANVPSVYHVPGKEARYDIFMSTPGDKKGGKKHSKKRKTKKHSKKSTRRKHVNKRR
jgi:hypothetical protein